MKSSTIIFFLLLVIAVDAQAHTSNVDAARHAFEHSWLAWLMIPLVASVVTLLLRR